MLPRHNSISPGKGPRHWQNVPNAQGDARNRAAAPRHHYEAWAWIGLAALLIAASVGCVSKAKAKAQAREAFLAGQNQALMQLQQKQGPSVRLEGEVRNPVIPWTEDLTLAKALVAAEYYGRTGPRTILLVRNGRAIIVEPKSLLSGQDVPLEVGDIIELRN